jgi:hypothetical protein
MRLGELTDDERRQVESGDLRLKAIESVRPPTLSAFERFVFRGWQRLAPGRRTGGFGAGSIPWRDVQEWMDRSGVESWRREQVEAVIYTIDAAAQKEIGKRANRKV